MSIPQSATITWRRAIAVPCVLAGTLTLASAQQVTPYDAERATTVTAQGAAAKLVSLETRLTRGQPYSGEAVTEFIQQLADGNRIVRRTTTRLYRDSEGRTRREQINDSPSGSNQTIEISDPVAGVSWVLDPVNKTAQQIPVMFSTGNRVMVSGGAGGAVSTFSRSGGTDGQVQVITPLSLEERRAVEARAAESRVRVLVAETAASGATTTRVTEHGEASREDLGEQTIEGVRAKGTRTTTVIPAGAIGNEQPLTTISEQWFSEELGVLVLTRHSDPRVGETTYRLSNIVRSEPDRALFQAPADYTVREAGGVRRRPPQ